MLHFRAAATAAMYAETTGRLIQNHLALRGLPDVAPL